MWTVHFKCPFKCPFQLSTAELLLYIYHTVYGPNSGLLRHNTMSRLPLLTVASKCPLVYPTIL